MNSTDIDTYSVRAPSSEHNSKGGKTLGAEERATATQDEKLTQNQFLLFYLLLISTSVPQMQRTPNVKEILS